MDELKKAVIALQIVAREHVLIREKLRKYYESEKDAPDSLDKEFWLNCKRIDECKENLLQAALTCRVE